MKHKVFAFIIRDCDGRCELLVFDHRDYPEAGAQVPVGTVEDGLFREEAGLGRDGLRVIRKVAEHRHAR